MYENYKIVYHNDFEIIELKCAYNEKVKVNGKNKYARIIIKPIFKIDDLTGEVIDEEKQIIHRCHPYMTQIIADAIIEQRIEDMKEKNHIFNAEQIENLRTLCICLYHQQQNEQAEEIEEQYISSKSFNPMTYEEIIDKYLPLITKKTLTKIKNKFNPIYKLRGEKLPMILKNLVNI